MLIGNGRLIDKLPMSFLGRDGLNNLQPGVAVSSTLADSFGALAAMPDGYYQPQGWMLPRKAGRIAAQFKGVGLQVSASGAGSMGINTSGTASITFATTGTGSLISSASGIGGITLTAAGNIFASKNTSGTASILFGATGALTALGHTAGAASITFSAQWAPYAVGWLSGSSAEQGLTVSGITNAIWGALSANYNDAGTMGNKLNSAASGGVDYAALGAAVLAALNADTIPVNIKQINDVPIEGAGVTGNEWGPV